MRPHFNLLLQQAFRGGCAALQTLGGLFFPPLCPGCLGDSAAAHALCAACQQRIAREVIEAPFCATCSRPFRGAEVGENLTAFVCAECRERRAPAFTHAVAGHLARGVVRELIHAFKYEGRFYLRRPLTDWLQVSLANDSRLRDFRPDALVAVPLHPRRQRARGYNQAAVLAALLGRHAGLPFFAHAVRRVRDTPTQTHLTREERIENLRGAFLVPPRKQVRIAGRRLLLLDDVFTTGSTVNACARALRDAGAAEVRVLAV
ncbi:MAG: ComF family protein, partial [Verrucomicrobia bacterium]|nr:ComF family protein [Verrucomicrobiota bacterium]